ncbi:Halomucin [Frankliniella fusca]|uniref:Halomucin n=1 Tax=Frankliniella fusca TaxID=407009 RepID=A0AAE1GYT1_9NEOP|nr:Halomucin [Frankliniella fusca]
MSAALKRTLQRQAVRTVSKRERLDELVNRLYGPQPCNDSDSDSEILPVVDCHGDVIHPFNPVGTPEQDSAAAASDHDENGSDRGDGNDPFEIQRDQSESEDELIGSGSDQSSRGCDSINDHEANSGDDLASSDSDGDTHIPDFDELEQFIIDAIRERAQEPGVLSMSKLDALLHKLNPVLPKMPLSYTTLFDCPYNFDITELPSGGKLWYKGFRGNLDKLDLKQYLEEHGKIVFDIGIDGLPLVNVKLWPILAYLKDTDNDPFIISVYLGKEDPKNPHDFFQKYCVELKDLLDNGYRIGEVVFEVEVRNYILDAAARSFVKCCVRHNGHAGCEKCVVWGESIDNRMVFKDSDAPLRSDDSYKNREQPRHHRGDSPLEELGTGMVSAFRLDPMPLLWAGVSKRLINYWLNKIGPWKLHFEVIDLVSSVFDFLKGYCPVDFNRKPRSLKFFKTFKCTELRRIVLYDGILAFKDLIDENVYKHFLLFHAAVYILSNKSLHAELRDVASELIRTFVSHASEIYGSTFVVYNVHSMIHLVAECDRGLMLDDISAFKFENQLKSIKQTLRSGLHHLQQLARRDAEKQSSEVKMSSSKATSVVLSFKRPGFNNRFPGQHYRRLKAGKLLLKLGKSDSCVSCVSGDIIVIKDIVQRQKKVYLIGRKFMNLQDFYEYPLPSSQLGIYKVSELGRELMTFRLRHIESKYYLMPDGDGYLCFVVIRFYPTLKDPEEYMEVSLASWLVGDLDDNMNGYTRWPPDSKPISQLVKNEIPADDKWEKFRVQVMRFYGTFIDARAAAPKFLVDSNYETEDQELPVKRCRIRTQRFIESSSDEEVTLKTSTKAIKPPPPTQMKPAQQVTRRQNQSTDERKKREREASMEKLKRARAVAARHSINVTHKSPSALRRSNAFCLSPDSAASYTSRILSRIEEKKAQGQSSAPDGRRNLFPAKEGIRSDNLADLEARLKRIEECQLESSAKIDLMLMNIGRLQRSLVPAEMRIVAPHKMPKIPLQSEQDLKAFEKFLEQSDSNLSAVCDYMSSYVRSSVPDPERKSAHSILSQLLYNELAKKMNLEGGNKKIGFRSLHLYKVFQGTLKNAFPKSDLLVAEDALQKWLKDAKWRKNKLHSPKQSSNHSSRSSQHSSRSSQHSSRPAQHSSSTSSFRGASTAHSSLGSKTNPAA